MSLWLFINCRVWQCLTGYDGTSGNCVVCMSSTVTGDAVGNQSCQSQSCLVYITLQVVDASCGLKAIAGDHNIALKLVTSICLTLLRIPNRM